MNYNVISLVELLETAINLSVHVECKAIYLAIEEDIGRVFTTLFFQD